jgi:predicted ATPase
MNEQLIVKNFGPIKDATVGFKRVTVFIGPTGGGKSTLAKLAATFRELGLYTKGQKGAENALRGYGIDFASNLSLIDWKLNRMSIRLSENDWKFFFQDDIVAEANELARRTAALHERANALVKAQKENGYDTDDYTQQKQLLATEFQAVDDFFSQNAASSKPFYIPAERGLLSVLDDAWPVLIKDRIGLPPVLLFFAQGFLEARAKIKSLSISMLNIDYEHSGGKDFIILPIVGQIPLGKAASGIQSVIPLVIIIEHLSRRPGRAQSFIIEEPELNLYPTAQQGLLNWLVEKCTQGENDLTITTHSPYILSHLNLLLYAHQVAEKHPDRAEDVAELVPRTSWINPKEFACYQVENGGVTSLVNEELGLIDDNGLDNLSGDAADAFDNLIRLSKGVARK